MHISTERQSTKLIVHEMVSLGPKQQPILYSSHIPCNYNTIRLCDEWSNEYELMEDKKLQIHSDF